MTVVETAPYTEEQQFLVFGSTSSDDWFDVRRTDLRQRYELAQYENGKTKNLGRGTLILLDVITSPTVVDLRYEFDRTGKILEGRAVLGARLYDELDRAKAAAK
jgi:hypothetical protein